MATEQPDYSTGALVGDYCLGEVVGECEETKTWQAEQVSMGRAVILEALKPDWVSNPQMVEAFLADVRAKAAVDHPSIGSVYEAVQSEVAVYYARETVEGETLLSLGSGKRRFPPPRILRILEQIGEAMIYLEEKDLATEPLELNQVTHSAHDTIRLMNPAVGGERSEATTWRDREMFSQALKRILRPGEPGCTRVGRLLDFLTEQGEEAVTWLQVVHTAEKLRKELEEGSRTAAIAGPPKQQSGSGWGFALVLVATVATVVLVGGGILVFGGDRDPPPPPKSPPMLIPAGTYPGAGGGEVRTARFWIDPHEVSIGEYARFLEALELVSEDSRMVYDHPEQPAAKKDHVPEEWELILSSAQEKLVWNELAMTLRCPMVRVDWWDAYAYAKWKGGRLPTSKEWSAARRGTLPAWSGWGPVGASSEDLADGIHGLAGNVSEWSRDP